MIGPMYGPALNAVGGGVAMTRVIASLSLAVIITAVIWNVGLREPTEGAFPSRPIEILVGYSAGGGTDVLTRRLAGNMEKTLGVPINIINKPGGGGLVAMQELVARPADGYTLGVLLGNQFLQKHFNGADSWIDPLQDVTLIGVFNRDVWGIAVQDAAAYDTLDQFISYARANPGLCVGAGSPGSLYYWTWEVLMDMTGIELTIVPYGGTSQALTALAGGELVATGALPSEAESLAQSGLAKMIGVASETRLTTYPNLPTFIEQGYNLVIGPWRSIVAPAGLPEDVSERLQVALQNAYESDDFQAFMESRDFGPLYRGPTEGMEFLRQEDQFFRTLMERRGQARGQ